MVWSEHKVDIYSHDDGKPLRKLAAPPNLDRLGSFIIDGLLVGILTTLFVSPWKWKVTEAQILEDWTTFFSSSVLMVLVSVIVVVSYQSLFLYFKGATPGKLFFGIKVINIFNQKNPGFLDSIVRSLFWW
jgi:uncharacterized RDD family membrane protein YckC